MNKYVQYFLILALVAFVIMQFIRPNKNNEGYETVVFFEQEIVASDKVAELLKTNCYDCHSNHTVYPWYAEIAPVSYWLDEHIEHGKEHFNISTWEMYSAKKKDHKLEELIEYIEEEVMPLDSYTWMHGDLSEEDTKLLLDWAKVVRLRYQKEINSLTK